MKVPSQRVFSTCFILLSAVLAVGCMSTGKGERLAAPDRNRITAEEMESLDSGMNALQIVQRLRPHWLQGRGPTSVRGESPLPVYVNNQRVAAVVDGDGTALQSYRRREIREIVFLDSMNATQRFGTGHPSGAIMLYLR